MKPATKARKRSETPKLSREDWLDAAFKAVVEGGFDGVRVLSMADTLGVTRGSFYWHFSDHADLISALLARWRKREVDLDQSLQAEATDDPQADLQRLLEAALAHAGRDLENMRFELALRGLGRRDAAVATLLVEIDQLRMRLFEHKFMRLTGDAGAASDLAALFYLAIAGSHQALSRPSSPPQAKDYLKGIIGRFLIQGQAPALSARRASQDN
ncbi:MAG: TetR/AcrR family transcriptional regulator [Rhodoferax sp.]